MFSEVTFTTSDIVWSFNVKVKGYQLHLYYICYQIIFFFVKLKYKVYYIFFQIGHRRLNWIQNRQRFSRTMHKSSWTYLYQRSWSSIWGWRSHLCPRVHPRQWQFNSQRHPSFGHVSCFQIMYKNGNNNFMSDYFFVKSINLTVWKIFLKKLCERFHEFFGPIL